MIVLTNDSALLRGRARIQPGEGGFIRGRNGGRAAPTQPASRQMRQQNLVRIKGLHVAFGGGARRAVGAGL